MSNVCVFATYAAILYNFRMCSTDGEVTQVAKIMTSNAIRGIRRKKSSLSEVKVAVVGAPGVGKSGKSSLLFIYIIINVNK